jgi:ABC-type multidrug transport system ATPase subunit
VTGQNAETNMLKSLKIRDFHSCVDVSLDNIDNALLLVGPNGAGKTTILRALCWLREVATEGGMVDGYAHYEKSSVCVTFQLDDELFQYEVTALMDPEENLHSSSYKEQLSKSVDDTWAPIFTRDKEQLVFFSGEAVDTYSIGVRASSLTFLLSTALDSTRSTTISKVAAYLSAIKYYPLDAITGAPAFLGEEDFQKWQVAPGDANAAVSVLCKLIHMSQNDTAAFDELKAILGPGRLDLLTDIAVRIHDATEPPRHRTLKGKSYSVFFYLHRDGVAYYDELSFGTKRILQIATAILHDRSAAILLEQPEDGIHPGLLVRLMRVLLSYTDPTQLFITSHSPTVINTVGARDIWLVQAPQGKTLCHRLTEDEIRKAGEYVDEVGQLADYVRLLED